MPGALDSLRFTLETRAPRLVKLLMRVRSWFGFWDQWQSRRAIHRLIAEHHASLQSDLKDLELWERAFSQYLQRNPRNLPIFESFMQSKIQLLQKSSLQIQPDDHHPIVLCVVKNDLGRLQMVVEHHRSLGCTHFAILDNGSDDGTIPWLLAQPDCDIYQVLDPFKSQKKYGWINQILARYGFDQWFLYVDSDELLVYPACESRPLESLVNRLQSRQSDRLAAILLDMYSQDKLYAETQPDLSIRQRYCYFDADSYTLAPSRRGPAIKGGPRQRLFVEAAEDSPLLIKFPLFQLRPGLIFESAHYLFPYLAEAPIEAAILHYKFLPSDLKRHRIIAREGSFQGGSREYKRYLGTYEKNADLSFWFSGSIHYVDSSSLAALPLIEDPFAVQETRA